MAPQPRAGVGLAAGGARRTPGRRRAYPFPPAARRQQCGPGTGRVPFPPAIHRPAQWRGEERQGFGGARLAGQRGPMGRPQRIGAEAEPGGCCEGPLQGHRAELVAAGARALTGGGAGAVAQAGRGNARPPPGAAVESMALIEEPHSEALPHAGEGAQAVPRLEIMGLGGLDHVALARLQPVLVRGDHPTVHCDRLAPPGVWQTVGHTGPSRWVRALLAARWEVGLTVGVLNVRQQGGSLAHESQAAPQQLPRAPQLGRSDRGLGQPTSAEQPRALGRGNRLILALPPGMACMESAWPSPNGRPAWAQRAASRRAAPPNRG
jgi:hypothetical protein